MCGEYDLEEESGILMGGLVEGGYSLLILLTRQAREVCVESLKGCCPIQAHYVWPQASGGQERGWEMKRNCVSSPPHLFCVSSFLITLNVCFYPPPRSCWLLSALPPTLFFLWCLFSPWVCHHSDNPTYKLSLSFLGFLDQALCDKLFFCRLPRNRFPRLETGENKSEWDILRTWYLEGYYFEAWRSGFLIAQSIYQHWRQHPYRSIFVGTLLYHRIMNHWCFASLRQIAETDYIKRYA